MRGRYAVLSAYLRDCLAEGFCWGTRDCCSFGADWVRRVRGIDPAAAWRGTYGCARAAVAAIAAAGGLVRLCARGLEGAGLRRLPRWRRRRIGDVVVAAIAGRELVGLVSGGGFVSFRTEHGLGAIHRPQILAAWAI